MRNSPLLPLFLCLCSSPAICGQEVFDWEGGRLAVPGGFAVTTRHYVEGVVTTLHYPDGAQLILQQGGMTQIPMLQGAEYLILSKTKSPAKTIRRGKIRDRRWREDNLLAP